MTDYIVLSVVSITVLSINGPEVSLRSNPMSDLHKQVIVGLVLGAVLCTGLGHTKTIIIVLTS